MTWILGITVAGIVAFAIVIVRQLKSAPRIERPNFEEKELNYRPQKGGRSFFIREDGIQVKNVYPYCCQ